MKRLRKQLLNLNNVTALLLFSCLAVGPGQAAESEKSPNPAPPAVSAPLIQPIRVVYRQIEGTFLKSPRGVWVDRAKNEVYVADTSNDLVAVYDSAGLPLFAFGYNKELKEPTKAVANSKGRIFVLNGIPRAVKVFNYRGEYIEDFRLARNDSNHAPTAIAIDQSNNLYVGTAGEGMAQIEIYDSNFRFIREIGKKPDRSSYLKSVHAMTIDSDGTLYVADANATPAIQVYGPDGKYLRGWGAHDGGPQNFSLPAGIALDGQGRVVVIDSIRQVVSVFTKDGSFLSRSGGMGTQAGAFMFPTDIASNGNQKLYVVERLGSRLQVLEERIAAVRANPNAAAVNALREQMRRQFNDFSRGIK